MAEENLLVPGCPVAHYSEVEKALTEGLLTAEQVSHFPNTHISEGIPDQFKNKTGSVKWGAIPIELVDLVFITRLKAFLRQGWPSDILWSYQYRLLQSKIIEAIEGSTDHDLILFVAEYLNNPRAIRDLQDSCILPSLVLSLRYTDQLVERHQEVYWGRFLQVHPELDFEETQLYYLYEKTLSPTIFEHAIQIGKIEWKQLSSQEAKTLYWATYLEAYPNELFPNESGQEIITATQSAAILYVLIEQSQISLDCIKQCVAILAGCTDETELFLSGFWKEFIKRRNWLQIDVEVLYSLALLFNTDISEFNLWGVFCRHQPFVDYLCSLRPEKAL